MLLGQHDTWNRLTALPVGKPVLWMHCASLGEFEQGRPVLEFFAAEHPNYAIVLTFFSPSGYTVRKDYKGATVVCYLPLDNAANAKRFIQMVDPAIIIFVKYELWFNYLRHAQTRGIPTALISAHFRPRQWLFKWYGQGFLPVLKGFDNIFTQNIQSKDLLLRNDVGTGIVAGDTRFDRVYQLAQKEWENEVIKTFCGGRRVIVAGSTWPQDVAVLMPAINQLKADIKVIVAPHEVDEKYLAEVEQAFKGNTIRYSKATAENVATANLLIIDNVGMLSKIYRYGHIAWVGGGFKQGLHNILEPAVYGLPVLFGPNYSKFLEARELSGADGAFAVENSSQAQAIINRLLNDTPFYRSASDTCNKYVKNHTGATALILKWLEAKVAILTP